MSSAYLFARNSCTSKNCPNGCLSSSFSFPPNWLLKAATMAVALPKINNIETQILPNFPDQQQYNVSASQGKQCETLLGETTTVKFSTEEVQVIC